MKSSFASSHFMQFLEGVRPSLISFSQFFGRGIPLSGLCVGLLVGVGLATTAITSSFACVGWRSVATHIAT